MEPLAFLRIQHLEFRQFSTFDLDDIEGRVIPLFKGFPGVIIWIRGESKGQIRGQRLNLTSNQMF